MLLFPAIVLSFHYVIAIYGGANCNLETLTEATSLYRDKAKPRCRVSIATVSNWSGSFELKGGNQNREDSRLAE